MNRFRCDVCNNITIGKKYNPFPVVREEGKFCCSDCHLFTVIPTRLSLIGDTLGYNKIKKFISENT